MPVTRARAAIGPLAESPSLLSSPLKDAENSIIMDQSFGIGVRPKKRGFTQLENLERLSDAQLEELAWQAMNGCNVATEPSTPIGPEYPEPNKRGFKPPASPSEPLPLTLSPLVQMSPNVEVRKKQSTRKIVAASGKASSHCQSIGNQIQLEHPRETVKDANTEHYEAQQPIILTDGSVQYQSRGHNMAISRLPKRSALVPTKIKHEVGEAHAAPVNEVCAEPVSRVPNEMAQKTVKKLKETREERRRRMGLDVDPPTSSSSHGSTSSAVPLSPPRNFAPFAPFAPSPLRHEQQLPASPPKRRLTSLLEFSPSKGRNLQNPPAEHDKNKPSELLRLLGKSPSPDRRQSSSQYHELSHAQSEGEGTPLLTGSRFVASDGVLSQAADSSSEQTEKEADINDDLQVSATPERSYQLEKAGRIDSELKTPGGRSVCLSPITEEDGSVGVACSLSRTIDSREDVTPLHLSTTEEKQPRRSSSRLSRRAQEAVSPVQKTKQLDEIVYIATLRSALPAASHAVESTTKQTKAEMHSAQNSTSEPTKTSASQKRAASRPPVKKSASPCKIQDRPRNVVSRASSLQKTSPSKQQSKAKSPRERKALLKPRDGDARSVQSPRARSQTYKARETTVAAAAKEARARSIVAAAVMSSRAEQVREDAYTAPQKAPSLRAYSPAKPSKMETQTSTVATEQACLHSTGENFPQRPHNPSAPESAAAMLSKMKNKPTRAIPAMTARAEAQLSRHKVVDVPEGYRLSSTGSLVPLGRPRRPQKEVKPQRPAQSAQHLVQLLAAAEEAERVRRSRRTEFRAHEVPAYLERRRQELKMEEEAQLKREIEAVRARELGRQGSNCGNGSEKLADETWTGEAALRRRTTSFTAKSSILAPALMGLTSKTQGRANTVLESSSSTTVEPTPTIETDRGSEQLSRSTTSSQPFVSAISNRLAERAAWEARSAARKAILEAERAAARAEREKREEEELKRERERRIPRANPVPREIYGTSGAEAHTRARPSSRPANSMSSKARRK